MTNVKNEIAELKAELARLKASVAPEPLDAAAMARFKDEMHQLAERRAARHNPFSPDQLAEMERACSTNFIRDIARRDSHAPQGPASYVPSTAQQDIPRGVPGNGTGWAREIPISNPPGTSYCDQLMDAQDAKDRLALMEAEAERQVLLKAPEPK